MRLVTTLLVATLGLAVLAPLSAEAATRGTARASADVAVRSGPGMGYDRIGVLKKDIPVRLKRCTRNSNWCLFLGDDDQPVGWVKGSMLIGGAAKLQATPHEYLGFNPLDPLDFCGPDRDGDLDDSDVFCEQ